MIPFLQPILSPSILDHLINNDRKLPPEYNLPHTYVEMQVRGCSEPARGWAVGKGAALAEAQTWSQAVTSLPSVEGRHPPTLPHLGLVCKETSHSAAHTERDSVCHSPALQPCCPVALQPCSSAPTVPADSRLPLHGLPRGDRRAGLVHGPQSVQVSAGDGASGQDLPIPLSNLRGTAKDCCCRLSPPKSSAVFSSVGN